MKLCFTDYPKYVPLEEYGKALDHMTDKLRSYPSLNSIYQIGDVSAPGISDIDMLAVFYENATCLQNPLSDLSEMYKYLFIHGMYGITRSQFLRANKFSFFHKYRLHLGEKLTYGKSELSQRETSFLKKQVALEYLLRWFISLSVELTYHIVRVRGFLMHAHAALYDLDFLEVKTGDLLKILQKISDWRSHWFKDVPKNAILSETFQQLYGNLELFLKEKLKSVSFYLPDIKKIELAPHIHLIPAENFNVSHRGFRMPAFFCHLGRKYFNVQNRFNLFTFRFPAYPVGPKVISSYFNFNKEITVFNKNNFPFFIPLSSSLNIY